MIFSLLYVYDFPSLQVLGAGSDYIVDRAGVAETAAFLGTTPVFLEGAPHDLMLTPRYWRESAEAISSWMRKNSL